MSDARSPKIYLLPNLMTAGNLFCGFAAVLRIYDGAQETDFLEAASDFHDAIWFILAACIFDLLDGRLARLGGHESPISGENSIRWPTSFLSEWRRRCSSTRSCSANSRISAG